MSLSSGILAKVDGQLRIHLRTQDEGLTARVPVSKEQWAVWKRYCDMVGVSVGGGLAVLVDHELARLIDENIESLAESVRSRERSVNAFAAEVAVRVEAVEKRERFCDFREQQIESRRRRLDEREGRLVSREKAVGLLERRTRLHAPVRTEPKPGRNQPCWCGSGKKYKTCHYDSDR